MSCNACSRWHLHLLIHSYGTNRLRLLGLRKLLSFPTYNIQVILLFTCFAIIFFNIKPQPIRLWICQLILFVNVTYRHQSSCYQSTLYSFKYVYVYVWRTYMYIKDMFNILKSLPCIFYLMYVHQIKNTSKRL